MLCCSSSQPRFIAPLSSIPALTLVSVCCTPSSQSRPEDFLEIAKKCLMVRCTLLCCCAVARLYGRLFYSLSLTISVSFCLYYPPTAGFICPLALITIKTCVIDAFSFPASTAFLSDGCFAGRHCHQHKAAVHQQDVIQEQVAPEMESQGGLASICTHGNTTATPPPPCFLRVL